MTLIVADIDRALRVSPEYIVSEFDSMIFFLYN